MSNIMYERIQQRVKQIGDEAVKSIVNGILDSGSKYRTDLTLGISSVKLDRIAELLATSAYWIATGLRDPFEIKMSARHSYDHEMKEHNDHDWDKAKSVLAAPASAYKQFDVPSNEFNFPYSQHDSPTVVAGHVRDRLIADNGEGFVSNFAKAIENSFNIDIFVLDYEDDFDAYAANIKYNTFIVTQTNEEWYRVNFGLAHELGHIVSNDLFPVSDINTADKSREKWANAFAAELLAPESSLRAVDWKKASQEIIARFIWNHKISVRVFKNNIARHGLMEWAVDAHTQMNTIDITEKYISKESIEEAKHLYAYEKFPSRLINEHKLQVKAGNITDETLSWMTKKEFSDTEIIKFYDNVSIDFALASLGLAKKEGP